MINLPQDPLGEARRFARPPQPGFAIARGGSKTFPLIVRRPRPEASGWPPETPSPAT